METLNIYRLLSPRTKVLVRANVQLGRWEWRRIRNRLNATSQQGTRVFAEVVKSDCCQLQLL